MTVNEMWVVLHGTCAIFEYDNAIEVRIPNLGDECVYRAGEWLAETTIRQGATLELRVPVRDTSVAGRFASDTNVIVRDKRPAVANSDVYATILLPTPHQVKSLARTIRPPMQGTVLQDAQRQEYGHGAAVHILVYRQVDFDQVTLVNHAWPLGDHIAPLPDDGRPVLSIIVDPEMHSGSPEHDAEVFDRMSRLFQGLGLTRSPNTRMGEGPRSEVPSFLARDFYHRNAWTARVGALMRGILQSQGMAGPSAAQTEGLVGAIGELHAGSNFAEIPWCEPAIVSRIHENRT